VLSKEKEVRGGKRKKYLLSLMLSKEDMFMSFIELLAGRLC